MGVIMDKFEALLNKLMGVSGPDGSASQAEQDQFDAIQLQIDEDLARQISDDKLRKEGKIKLQVFKKRYNSIRKGARKRGKVYTPNKFKVMNKGGMPKKNFAKPGSYSSAYNKGGMGKAKVGHTDYRKGGMIYTTKNK